MNNSKFRRNAIASGIILASAGLLFGTKWKANKKSSFFRTADKLVNDFKDLVSM